MIVTAKRLIVGDGHSVYLDYGLRIGQDGRIVELGKQSELLARYPEEETLSYPESTILPGLIDLHAHLGHYAPAPRQWQNPFMLAYITQHTAQKALRYGVTTLRDIASPHMVTQTMMTAADMGYFDLPRILPCGPGICITGGHGSAYGLGEGVEEVDGPWAARAAVRSRVKAGCPWTRPRPWWTRASPGSPPFCPMWSCWRARKGRPSVPGSRKTCGFIRRRWTPITTTL